MNAGCRICGKPIVLSPSAAWRAQMHGGKPADYSAAFDTHDDCLLTRRRIETAVLMARLRATAAASEVRYRDGVRVEA